MTFLLKTVEKLVLWEIEQTVLQENPLNRDQHAFRKHYSTDTNISDLVDNLEANVLRDKIS